MPWYVWIAVGVGFLIVSVLAAAADADKTRKRRLELRRLASIGDARAKRDLWVKHGESPPERPEWVDRVSMYDRLRWPSDN